VKTICIILVCAAVATVASCQKEQESLGTPMPASRPPEEGPPEPVPVIGVAEAELFMDEDLFESDTMLAGGVAVTILDETEEALQVRTEAGDEGWVRRFCVCSKAEWEPGATGGLPASALRTTI